MPLVEGSLADLQDRVAETREPPDFSAFWQEAIAQARRYPIELGRRSAAPDLRLLRVDDLTFPGFGGQPVAAWLLLPAEQREPLPAVVQYVGYGGGRGLPHEWLPYVAAGFAVLVMDSRGQGGGGSISADTADDAPFPVGPSAAGFVTRGIEDPRRHYLLRLIVDAVRAVDAVRTLPEVDPDRVAVAGISQGGGLALLAGSLLGDVQAILADVPFLCDFRRGAAAAADGPYLEIARFLRGNRGKEDQVFSVLDYFDVVNAARRATVPAWFSVALMDTVCPPSTVLGAFNAYAGPRELTVFPFSGHEAGGGADARRRIGILDEVLRG